MKIRFYPKKEHVLTLLASKLDLVEGDLHELEEKQAKLKSSTLYRSPDLERAEQQKIDAAVCDRDELNNQIRLLESHDPPEVMAELEV